MATTQSSSPIHFSITKLVLVTCGILIGIAVLFRLIRPQSITPPAQPEMVWQNNFDGSKTNFNRVTFTGTGPEVSTQLPVIYVSQVKTSTSAFAQQLVESFQLQLIEEGFWGNDDYSLNASAESECLTLSRSEPTIPTQTLSQTAATQVATQLLDHLFGQSTLAMIPAYTQFLRGEYHLSTAPPSLADYIELTFAPTISGLPVLNSLTVNPTARIMINSNNEVQKLEICPFLPSFSPKSELPTISVNEAVKNINHNQALVLQAIGLSDPLVDITTVESGTLDRVNIEYRTSPDGSEAMPYYRFTGQLINNTGIEMLVEVLTPAVSM